MKKTSLSVIKIGSAVLTREDGSLNNEVISGIVADIAHVLKHGSRVILVSSGAVASGRISDRLRSDFPIKTNCYKKDIVRQQVLASVGQPHLMASYSNAFKKKGSFIAQILVTRSDFVDREKYLSLRDVVYNLLENDIVPIINENDVLSDEELQFSDNDQLACLVSAMVNADTFLLLTNVDGVYDRPPNDPGAKLISKIRDVEAVLKTVRMSKSSVGRGGMRSKLQTAHLAMSLGIDMRIANGKRKNVIKKILSENESIGTAFPTKQHRKRSMKTWIASAAHPKGKIMVNVCLTDILMRKKSVSILLTGVEAVEGVFHQKDIVTVCDMEGCELGRGRIRYSSKELKALLEGVFHEESKYKDVDEAQNKNIIIHYDNFVYTV